MPGRFPYKTLEKYPHMKPEDVAVWERYIAANPAMFETVDYDVPLGAGEPVPPEQPEEMAADWAALTRKKIDLIAYRADGAVHLVEVKPIANMRALGQILTYQELYAATHPGIQAVPMVVANKVDRELAVMFAKHGIQVALA